MPDMYESLNHMKLYEQVVGRIEKLVIDGHLKPGDRLPAERELSDQFGVSECPFLKNNWLSAILQTKIQRYIGFSS
jgi:DNA-binding transcriptional MocR family regulator